VPRHTRAKFLTNSTFAICAVVSLAVSVTSRVCTAQSQNASGAIDLRTYESELQRYSDAIQGSRNNPAQIAAIRKSLPPEWNVEDAGTSFHVSTQQIDAALIELQSHPSDPAQVARDIEFRLSEMRQSAIDMEMAPVNDSLTRAETSAKRILSAREFQTAKAPSSLQVFEERWGQRIAKWIARMFSRLHVSQKTGNALAWTIITLGLLSLAYWIFRTLSQRERAPELPGASAEIIVSDAREWVRDAIAAAERGDYREAVHCAYWAAIARLEDLKLLQRDRARTPRESLRLLDAHPTEQTSLRNLTGHFELIWYGYRPASTADWSEAKILLEKFGCLAASTAPTANS